MAHCDCTLFVLNGNRAWLRVRSAGAAVTSLSCALALRAYRLASGCLCPCQVHEEVLRLLLAAAPRIDLLRLANYLHTTLANSRRWACGGRPSL